MHVLLLFSTPRPLTTALGAPWRHLGWPFAGAAFPSTALREGARGQDGVLRPTAPSLALRVVPGWLNLPSLRPRTDAADLHSGARALDIRQRSPPRADGR